MTNTKDRRRPATRIRDSIMQVAMHLGTIRGLAQGTNVDADLESRIMQVLDAVHPHVLQIFETSSRLDARTGKPEKAEPLT